MKITSTALDTIRAHGVEGYPNEICGFLVGRLVDDVRVILEAWPVRNAWETDQQSREGMLGGLETVEGNKGAADWEAHGEARRFFISPRDTLEAMKRARTARVDLVGVYHTHPDHPAIPSGFDRDAAVPGWSYIIASVRGGEVGECRSWEIDEKTDQFVEEIMDPEE